MDGRRAVWTKVQFASFRSETIGLSHFVSFKIAVDLEGLILVQANHQTDTPRVKRSEYLGSWADKQHNTISNELLVGGLFIADAFRAAKTGQIPEREQFDADDIDFDGMDPCLESLLKTLFSLLDPQTQQPKTPNTEFFNHLAEEIQAVFDSPATARATNTLKSCAFVSHSEETLLEARSELLADTPVHLDAGPHDSADLQDLENKEDKDADKESDRPPDDNDTAGDVEPSEDFVIVNAIGLFGERFRSANYQPPATPPRVFWTPEGIFVGISYASRASLVVELSSPHVRTVSFAGRNLSINLVTPLGLTIYFTSDQIYFKGASLVAAGQFADTVFIDQVFTLLGTQEIPADEFIKRSLEAKKEIVAELANADAKVDRSAMPTIAIAISCLRLGGRSAKVNTVFQLLTDMRMVLL